MNIRVALQFYPNQANPARPSGKGVYRVTKCWPTDDAHPLSVWGEGGRKRLHMTVSREFKRGSRMDPLKAVLAARAPLNATPVV